MTIHAVNYNLQLANVIVDYRDRPEGSESKLNTFSDGAKVLFKILQLFKNYRPRQFFGGISLVMFILAAILVAPVILEYFATGLVPRFPTLIVSGFMILAALQSFFAGLILSESCHTERRTFEYRYNEMSKRALEEKENA
jgi:hypothetical protein